MNSTLKACIGAVCALAIAPAAASADSIAYIKDGNVWIANPDGSGQHQVTDSSREYQRWHSPAQADDGTIVASHGEEIVKLKQNGEELARFDPPAAPSSVGGLIDGVPLDIAVSPDGSKIAFAFYTTGCPVGASCGERQVVTYSHSDRATDPATFGYHYNLRGPEWVSNDRIVAFGGHGRHANIDSPNGGVDDFQHWFDDPDEDVSDGEVSPQGDRLVYLRAYGDRLHLALVKVEGDIRSSVPAAPDIQGGCLSGGEATLDDPSWSPDGNRYAFALAQGIEVLEAPRDTCMASSKLVIPGGSEPDFGPANVNPGPKAHHGPNPCGKTAKCGAPEQPAQPPRLGSLSGKLRNALRKGLALTVATSEPGSVKVELLDKKKVAAKGSGYAEFTSAKVKVKFTSAARKSLARKRSVKLTARVTFKPADGGAATKATGKVTLKR